MGIDPPFRNVAIAGIGLLGGSLGLALRRLGVHVRGIGRSTERLETARRLGAIDDGTTDLARALGERDLVVLATPIEQILEDLARLGPLVGRSTVVTDVGSTKRAICKRALEALPAGVSFVGGHPLAGREVAGVEASDAGLFRGATWVLCPARLAGDALERLSALVEAVGAVPMVSTPEEHDRLAAWSSHLPQLLSTALASALAGSGEAPERIAAISGSGLRDMTRLAASPYSIWKGILETNADNVEAALAAAAAEIESMRRDFAAGRIEAAFTRAGGFSAAYRNPDNSAMQRGERKVLFLCTGNSCRSQMAEAIVNAGMSGAWEAFSAGTHPAGYVHPNALRVLEEIGIRHAGTSKPIDAVRDVPFDLVVTVCDAAAEECPVWLGAGKRVHLGFPDPARVIGNDEVVMPHFRRVRDEIAAKIPALLEKLG